MLKSLITLLFIVTPAMASDLTTVSSQHSQYFLPAPQPVEDGKKVSVVVPASTQTSAAIPNRFSSVPSPVIPAIIPSEPSSTSAPVYSLSKNEIARTISSKMPDIEKCYERELQTKPTIHGKIVTRFVIGIEGSVTKSEIQETTMNDIQTETCIAYIFSQMSFPKPGKGIVEVSYPVIFNVVAKTKK